MKNYKLKIYYLDDEVHECILPLLDVLDMITDWYRSSDVLSDIINSRALTFSITEVLK